MKKNSRKGAPPYRRITASEVLNRLFQYGVFDAEETLAQVLEEVTHAAREMRKLAKEHGGDTPLGDVVSKYEPGERAFVDEMREAIARLIQAKSDGAKSRKKS